jgi:hypothetical protein
LDWEKGMFAGGKSLHAAHLAGHSETTVGGVLPAVVWACDAPPERAAATEILLSSLGQHHSRTVPAYVNKANE